MTARLHDRVLRLEQQAQDRTSSVVGVVIRPGQNAGAAAALVRALAATGPRVLYIANLARVPL